MLREFNVDDIRYAEQILLKKGEEFDNERIVFIKNLDSIDLQAVPGSGKTTALLAKLLIIEKELPFKDGSGVLVISHTNAAVNQIKHRIGRFCPKLFSYPNYVGTIQGFVDQFLARPFAQNFLGVNLRWIDSELYQDRLWKKFRAIYWSDDYEKPGTLFYGRHIKNCLKEANQDNQQAKNLCDQRIEKEVKDLYFDYTDCSIKTFNDEKVILKDPSNKKYQGIKTIIDEIIKEETISFEYAYNMANALLKRSPIFKQLIRKRFRYVFVDEMQDMEKNQYQLLEDLFHCSEVVFQRIGDKNQAIFSGKINLEEIWIDREKRLPVQGSHRLSPGVAEVVNNFAIDKKYKIEGKRSGDILPHIIVFSDESIAQVIPTFTELIKKNIPQDVICASDYPIQVIGWIKEPSQGRLGIKSFYENFEPPTATAKIFYPNLKTHLSLSAISKDQKNLLGVVRKGILDAIITVFRMEKIVRDNGRYFSVKSLLKNLKESRVEFYEDFKLKMFIWSKSIFEGKLDETYDSIKSFLPELLILFDKQVSNSSDFINGDESNSFQENIKTDVSKKDNKIKCPNTGLEVKVGTVHSAKGETHLATLYVETYYNKKHESERLSNCFCGEKKILKNKQDKESARIAYVAMSRPTNLLCFAMHQDRYVLIKNSIKGWKIVEVTA
jgi:DNA helicase II / ATP-dependent DNA helicase PcrA